MVYKVKCNPDGYVEQYRVRLVAKRYNQREVLNSTETFTHVAKMVTVCTLFALVASS
jgi:hypothetical protein